MTQSQTPLNFRCQLPPSPQIVLTPRKHQILFRMTGICEQRWGSESRISLAAIPSPEPFGSMNLLSHFG